MAQFFHSEGFNAPFPNTPVKKEKKGKELTPPPFLIFIYLFGCARIYLFISRGMQDLLVAA